MSGKYKTKDKVPCLCGHNRWRTVGNDRDGLRTLYECRRCRSTRTVGVDKQTVETILK